MEQRLFTLRLTAAIILLLISLTLRPKETDNLPLERRKYYIKRLNITTTRLVLE